MVTPWYPSSLLSDRLFCLVRRHRKQKYFKRRDLKKPERKGWS